MAPPKGGTGTAPSFTIDVCNRFLDATVLHPVGALAVAGLSYVRAAGLENISVETVLAFFKEHDNRYVRWLLIFVAVKTLNRALNRVTLNNGWARDRPKFSLIKGKGDIVVITGGSTGIGKEVVEILSKKCGNIAVFDLAPPTYKAKNVSWYEVDVTSPESIAAAAAKVRAEYGEPTIIFNNAGIARGSTILDTTPEQFLLTYKVNVMGGLNLFREFLPHIIKINHGHIMTTASSASYITVPQLSEYACSKTAALALHETLGQELRHRYGAPRVRTSVICPTKVSTQMGDGLAEAENQFLTPTLSPVWLANEMVKIVSSGLSGHLVAPHFSALILPYLRAGPEWFKSLIHTVGKTHNQVTEKGRAEQAKSYGVLDILDKKHNIAS